MINKVSIRNFKSLRDVQIGLERFTVFVGPNASGKSSILQALDLLCRAFRDQGRNEEAEISEARSRGSSDFVELAAEHDGRGYRYRIGPPKPPRKKHPPPSPPGAREQQWSGEGCGVT